MTVHFWEILDPRPTFLCGKEPRQGVQNAAPAMRVTPASVAWFARHKRSCRNCLRVARARAAPREDAPPPAPPPKETP